MRFGLWPLVLCGAILGCSGGGSGSKSPVEPGPPPPPPPPTAGLAISSISPAELVEGQSATITGRGFKTFAALNSVVIGGTAVTVTSATETELRFEVPSLCRPAGPVDVQVRVGAATSEVVSHPFRASAQPLTIALGEMALVRAPDALCLQFGAAAADEQYLVGVQSTSEDVSSMVGLRVHGTPYPSAAALAASAVAPATNAVRPPSTVGEPTPVRFGGGRHITADRLRELLARHRASELRYRALETGLARTGRASIEAIRRGIVTSRLVAAAVPRVGDRLPIRVPDRLGTDPCVEFVDVSGVVEYIGQRGIFVVDEANPAGGFSGSQMAELARSFDEDIHPMLVERFGEPLDMDGNGRVIVVLTRKLNEWQSAVGVLGFVTAIDLVPRTTCASSNQGEYYYSIAPDPQGEAGEPLSTAEALELERLLIAHETTHVIQFGRRAAFRGATEYLERWQAEGQAMLAEEVVSLRLRSRTTGSNHGPDVLFDPDPEAWHSRAFGDLFGFYGFRTPTLRVTGAPERCSFLGVPAEGNEGPCIGNMAYGVSWAFLRWLSDQFGASVGGEAALHRAIIENTNTGFATIESTVGEPRSRLLAWWAASLKVDDRVAGADPRLSWTSWNLAAIEDSVVETARLSPRARGFSAFEDAIFVRAGSTAYFLLEGASRPATSFRVRTLFGAPPPEIQLWVVRLR